MATKYLDNTGLAYFWGKIKSWVTGRGYITSSGSITGNAGTATKLATARSISAGDLEFQGSANFDGSGNIALNVTNHRCIVSVSNTNYYPFHRIAYVPFYTGSWNDRGITFLVSKDYQGGGYGIARIIFRTNNVASQEAQCSVQWLCRTSDIAVDAIQVGFVKTAGASYLDIFYHSNSAYNPAVCRVIAHANARNGVGRGFTVVSASTEVSSTTATDPKTSVESYKTIADAGTALHNQAYTDVIMASDAGVAGSCVGNAATATRLAGPKHSYTTAANAAKNWYRIANANTHQMDTSKPLQIQFMLTAWNPDQTADYYLQWFVDCQVYGRNSGIRILGTSGAPFNQARVLYENTIADIDSTDRPAIDIYLNYVLTTACQIRVEEIYNSGWTFVADGVLSSSTIPSGFEGRAVGCYASGISNAGFCDYAARTRLQRSNITANATLANNDTYRSRVLNCTNAITITVPSIDSDYAWFLIKNFNAASTNKNVTIHPSTTSVLIDDSNADIVLKPGEWVIIASKAANSYTLISDGRWKSQKADKGTTLSDYGITDAKIVNGTITLGSNSITPLTSHQALPTLSKTDSGSGNAVTGISVSNHSITVTKGSTFLTSHQSLSDLGIGNVKNYDQSKAIKSITRSGTTFTYTCLDDTTGTFTQQDNNTTYTFATGDSDGQIKVTPSGGSAQNVSVKGLKSAAYTESSAYAAASHGTHVTFPSSGTPANIGTASNGTASTVARSDHVHALPDSGVTAGRYTSVNVDAKGRVTAGNVKHSYTTAANATKNWYRIANASTQQLDTSKPIHAQFILTAYNTSYAADYYEQWFVNASVFGRNAQIVIFGNTSVPFSQARILYENTVANIDANDRPALDIYLNYVLPNGTTKIEIEEVYNSGGWTFVADGQLAASTVPSGFENVACSVRNNGVERSTYADYVSYLNRQISSFTAAFTLADSYLYRSRTLNCTGTFTITVPSINSGYMWCVIKNKNTSSGVITLHPSTTSVLIDGSNADITLQPMEYVCIHSAGTNNYSIIADGRWKSQAANSAISDSYIDGLFA